jgi:hypothetical protein
VFQVISGTGSPFDPRRYKAPRIKPISRKMFIPLGSLKLELGCSERKDI